MVSNWLLKLSSYSILCSHGSKFLWFSLLGYKAMWPLNVSYWLAELPTHIAKMSMCFKKIRWAIYTQSLWLLTSKKKAFSVCDHLSRADCLEVLAISTKDRLLFQIQSFYSPDKVKLFSYSQKKAKNKGKSCVSEICSFYPILITISRPPEWVLTSRMITTAIRHT